jgi:bifunctional ADP-heptose synthase (sugar kinase/adenylyltransferase)
VDLYTFCTAIGKTSKTPTLSVKRGHTERFWGGSGLFARNLLGLGARVSYVTVCGDDWVRDYVSGEPHADLSLHLVVDPSRPSTLKERFWVDGYKLLQVDTVENAYVSPEIWGRVEVQAAECAEDCNLILLSDPRHGLMTPELIARLKSLGRKHGKPVIVDTQLSSRSGNLEEYVGVDLVCANETEARYFLRDEGSDPRTILDKLYNQTGVDRVLLKLGMNGVMGYDRGRRFFQFPAIPVQAVDPIGSGDAFLSAAALTYAPDIHVMASVFLATCAGAWSVTQMGTVPLEWNAWNQFVEERLDEYFD